MSSEIRSEGVRTYWIISNGNSFVDGITAPRLTTTVGDGWHIYWIGSKYSEYALACLNAGIIPRNADPDIAVTGISLEDSANLNTIVNVLELFNDKVNSLELKILDTFPDTNKIETELQSIIDTISIINTVIPGHRISSTQARTWLINNNIELSDVYSAINSIQDLKTRELVYAQWEYAPYIEKTNPWLSQLAGILGLSESDLDRAFIEGATL